MVAAAKVYSNYIFYSNLFNCLTKDVIAGKERLLEGARNGFGELKLPHRIGEIKHAKSGKGTPAEDVVLP